MNLELLNPFGRQVPDRIDSTLSLAPALHYFSQDDKTGAGSAATTTTNAEEASTTTSKDKLSAQERKARNRASAAKARKNGKRSSSYHDDIIQEDQEYRAAYHLMFNRRGSFLSCGYGSGTVAVFSFASRSLVALYCSRMSSVKDSNATDDTDDENVDDDDEPGTGVTSVSWSRQSRTLLSAGVGDARVKLWDNEHPFGRHQAWMGLCRQKQIQQEKQQEKDAGTCTDGNVQTEPASNSLESPQKRFASATNDAARPNETSRVFRTNNDAQQYSYSCERRHVSHQVLQLGAEIPPIVVQQQSRVAHSSVYSSHANLSACWQKHPCVSFDFHIPIGGPVQICPQCPTGGLAVLSDGSLVLFWVPRAAFVSHRVGMRATIDAEKEHDGRKEELKEPLPKAVVIPLWKEGYSSGITCAAFDHHGDRVYAATKNGMLLGFDVALIWKALLQPGSVLPTTPVAGQIAMETEQPTVSDNNSPSVTLPKVDCQFKISLGGSTAWHLLVSRNGKYLVVNSADGALRLFSTADLWEQPLTSDRKPTWLFQDLVSKVKFVCCDLSGMDGEFLVGGANGDDNKYELYIWNTTTGALMDKLTGSPVQLYSVAWHPTRAFIAVATSDGLIDVWGPKMDWTAFAPDFQALPANVEYVEEEGEFDVDADGRFVSEIGNRADAHDNETELVDVLTVEKVPVFSSDSEEEDDVFNFETTLCSSPAVRAKLKMPLGLEHDI